MKIKLLFILSIIWCIVFWILAFRNLLIGLVIVFFIGLFIAIFLINERREDDK